jgi:hypothetical protein
VRVGGGAVAESKPPRALLGRPADQGGLDYWINRIPPLGDVAFACNLTLSDECFNKAATRYP